MTLPRSKFLSRFGSSLLVFTGSLLFLLALGATAPFTKELGVCEAGAAEDVLKGNIILPHYHDDAMVQAPPLYWWTAALTVHLLGPNELAFRLPSLIAAAATCVALYLWGTSFRNWTFGIWIVGLMLTCHAFLDAARQPRMDALLTFFVTVSIFGLDKILNSTRPSILIQLGTGLALGMGILAKGPPGFILPLLAVVLAAFWSHKAERLLEKRLLLELGIGLSIGLAWYFAAAMVGGRAFIRWQIMDGLIRRFFGTTSGSIPCPNPPWYYILVLAKGVFPWTLFIPTATGLLVLQARYLPERMILATSWLITTLCFFSISHGKCFVYILPAFPALVIVLGYTLWQVEAEPDSAPKIVRSLFDGTAALFAAAALLTLCLGLILRFAGLANPLLWINNHIHIKPSPTDLRYLKTFVAASQDMRPFLTTLALVTFGGCATTILALISSRKFLVSLGVFLVTLAGTVLWFNVLTVNLATETSLKNFARHVRELVPKGAAIYYLGNPDCDFVFYSNLRVTPISRLSDLKPNGAYLVARNSDLEELDYSDRQKLRVLLTSKEVDSHGKRVLFAVTP